MSLTGIPLLVVVGLLTVAAFVGIFFAWQRVAGTPIIQGVLRWAMVLVNQVLAVFLVLLLANDAADFYPSWGDLFSSSGSLMFFPVHGDPPTATTDGLHRVGRAYPATRKDWASHGRLETIDFTGLASRLRTRALVFFPPEYFQKHDAHRRFPAIELLAGYPQLGTAFLGRGGAAEVELHLLRVDHVRPAVLVMLGSRLGLPRNTECTDVPAGPQAETFFATDVPLAMSRGYRVTQSGWGAAGYGSGGYCAAKLALTHYPLFSAAASAGATFEPRQSASTGDLWDRSSILARQSNLPWRLRNLAPPPTRLLLVTDADPTRADVLAADQLHGLARPPLEVSVHAVPGLDNDPAHTSLPLMLGWLGHRLPKPV